MARTALVTLDSAALIRTAPEQLEGSARMLLDTLAGEAHVPADGAQRSGAVGR